MTKSIFLLLPALFLLACSGNTTSQTASATTESQVNQPVTNLKASSETALNETQKEIVEENTLVSASSEKPTLSTAPPEPATKEKEVIDAKPAAIQVKQQTVKKEKPLAVNNTSTVATKETSAKQTSPPPATTDKPAVSSTPVTSTTSTSPNNTTTSPSTPGGKEAPKPKVEKPADTKVDHSPFDALLRKHVSNSGKVNYKGIKADQSQLDAYLKALADKPIQKDWSRNEQMAYWINAYNAFTIKLIIDNYPVKSITDLEGGKPWDKQWIKLGDKTYSLNQIENKILRPQFNEPAIHFAVNCAAKSCPPLLNRAWTADNLKTNFKKQAVAFINNPKYNKIEKNKATVSKIFDWYKEDFDNLIDYLNRYSSTQIDAGAKIEFMEYDWALNE